MNKWNRIVIHHSASDWGTARDINQWHWDRGWSGIGYHFVISNGYLTAEDYANGRQLVSMLGSIEAGRRLDLDRWVEQNEIGAHAFRFNADSIGICLIHREGPYPRLMQIQLVRLVKELMLLFDIEPDMVVGHSELDPAKPLCPGMDMNWFRCVLKGE